jgi:putative ABC transport system permease protein
MFHAPRKYARAVRLGIKNLMLHKMRAVLTMLGIIFGVCSVIAMLAIGEGASYEAQEAIKRLGSTNIIITSVKPTDDQASNTQEQSQVLEYGVTYQDVERITTTIPGIRTVLPIRLIREDVQYAGAKRDAQIIGTLPSYLQLKNLAVDRGRFLTDEDQRRRSNVCVLSSRLAELLFPYQDPLAEAVRIKGDYYRVVGVLTGIALQSRKGTAAETDDRSWEFEVYIPLATARAQFGENLIRRTSGSFSAERVQLHQVIVQMRSTDDVEEAAGAIQALLKRFHKKRDFEPTVPLLQLRQAEETKRMFNIVLGSIAAISLLVGGIGIMNIMLATVTERTREIGIRRALGARKRDITVQFLVETVVLSIGGGIIGVGMGVLIPYVVSELTEFKTIITPWSLIIAFGISGIIGIVFGIYPATRAANLDPIEALRHE